MRAQLLSLDVPEAPADPERFTVIVDATIGPEGTDRGEHFAFRVCTPAWLATAQRGRGFEFMRHTLLVDRWDLAVVREAIEELCVTVDERDWDALSQMLARFGRWEFDAWYPAAAAV